jgi:hypothetical protein
MTKSTFLSALLGVLFVAGLAIAPAYAQATRTWVSGVGDDANPCSRTAPCKTWAGAISKTATAGEIDALDPGGFGALTITKAITLDGGGGQVASVLTSGTNGITISAPSSVVILRNLRFNGLLNTSSPGLTGVSITSAGRVVIEKCDIFGFATTGITVATSTGTINVKVQETTINNNAAGMLVTPTGGIANISIERTHIDNNAGGGIKIAATGSVTNNVAITDSSVSLNASNAVNAVSGGGTVNVDLMRVIISNNGLAGVQSNQSGGGAAVVTVGESMLSYNGSAWSIVGGASLQTFKNNQVTGPMGSTPTQINFQ